MMSERLVILVSDTLRKIPRLAQSRSLLSLGFHFYVFVEDVFLEISSSIFSFTCCHVVDLVRGHLR